MGSSTSTHNDHNHNEASTEEEAGREEDEASTEEEEAGRESVVRRWRVRALSAFVSHSNSTHEEISADGSVSHSSSSTYEEEAGRESVVRRWRVRALSAFVSYPSSSHEEISADGADGSVSHSSSNTHGEISAEFSLPNEADADTVNNVVVLTILIGMGLTDSLLPTDEDYEESLGRQPPPDLSIEVIEGLLKKVEVVDNGDVCAICMDELKVNDEARAIGHCSHTFHLDCVAEWVKRKPTCPLCRFEIPINGEGDDQGVKRRRLV